MFQWLESVVAVRVSDAVARLNFLRRGIAKGCSSVLADVAFPSLSSSLIFSVTCEEFERLAGRGLPPVRIATEEPYR